MGEVLIGTCGYSYREWEGPFYPAQIKPDEYLRFYANEFSTVEIDNSYYKMPNAGQLQNMLDCGGPDLFIALKAVQTLTHNIEPDKWRNDAKIFIEAIEPLQKAGRLVAVLFQFPYSFHYTADNRKHLDCLLGEFEGISSAVEFRNGEWSSSRVIDGLKKRGVSYVSTDLPDIKGLPPVLDVSTGPLSYFRLHGRNTETWWGSDSKSRYDYLYTDKELEGAAERIKHIAIKADKLVVYFNNHTKAKAISNARSLQKILDTLGIPSVRKVASPK
ncbi:MAG: DUF72 domain-containing protein [Treponema sp.]|nr:DUF72 domain-containing protein [Treponema sp.]